MHIVFGGSFNPPTKAHLDIVLYLLNLFPTSKMIIVPVGDDYKKSDLISFHHRYEMLNIMTKDNQRIILSDLESQRVYQGTLKTLEDLSTSYDQLHFVIGADNLSDLPNWIEYQKLLEKYPFIVMHRQGYLTEIEANHMYKDLKHHFIFVEFDHQAASSLIRKNVIKYHDLLDHEVYQYILKHHLYGV